jgi:cysteine desulfurase/selenocysteine lyase
MRTDRDWRVVRRELLEEMPPYQGGGDMISSVTFEKTTYNTLPYKFEAGTPNIAGAVGLAAAVDYVTAIGMDAITAHERELLAYGTAALSGVPGLTLIGTAPEKASVLSFVMDGVHPHDIGTVVDQEGVAIHGAPLHAALMHRWAFATARASLALYNTREEIDALGAALHKVRELFT